MGRRYTRTTGRRTSVRRRVGSARRRYGSRRIGGNAKVVNTVFTIPIKSLIQANTQAWLGISTRAPVVYKPQLSDANPPAVTYSYNRIGAVLAYTSSFQNYWIRKVSVSFQVPGTINTPMIVAASVGHVQIPLSIDQAHPGYYPAPAQVLRVFKGITDSSKVQVSGQGGNTIARYQKSNDFNNLFLLSQTSLNGDPVPCYGGLGTILQSSPNIWIGFQAPATGAGTQAGITAAAGGVNTTAVLNVEIKYHLSPRGTSSLASSEAVRQVEQLKQFNQELKKEIILLKKEGRGNRLGHQHGLGHNIMTQQ